MLAVEEIKRFIDDDAASQKKKLAEIGQKYYDGDHDIKSYKLFYVNADGKVLEDTTRSNVKISHPFFTELVDQAVQYILSGSDGFIKSDIPELQTELDKYFNEDEDFIAELSNRRLSRAISADYFRRKHLSQSAVNEAKAHYIGCHRRLSRAYFSSAMAGLK